MPRCRKHPTPRELSVITGRAGSRGAFAGPVHVLYPDHGMSTETPSLEQVVDALVDEYRQQCLWFLPGDVYPRTFAQRLRALRYIERHGDRAAYVKAAKVRRWLLRTSSDASAVS